MATLPAAHINKSSYKLIGQGPLYAEKTDSNVDVAYLVTETKSAPSASSEDYMTMRDRLSYTGSEYVYMRLLVGIDDTTIIKVTEVK